MVYSHEVNMNVTGRSFPFVSMPPQSKVCHGLDDVPEFQHGTSDGGAMSVEGLKDSAVVKCEV